MILDGLETTPEAFEAGTGWHLAPEGACRGELCVPLGHAGGARVDVPEVAELLGMPLVHDAEAGLWALGPAVLGGRALETATAPELELPELDGRPFRLSTLEGRKIVLYAWAPY